MKVQILSDIHLEWYDYKVKNTDADTLILCGDILVASVLEVNINPDDPNSEVSKYRQFLQDCSDNYKNVIYVIGNHEFYCGMWEWSINVVKAECEKYGNIHVLENDTVVIDGIRFVGATLWTSFFNNSPIVMLEMEGRMSDYIRIYNENTKCMLKPHDTVERHAETMHYFKHIIPASNELVVVCTHHAPSKRSVHPDRYSDSSNAAYITELDEFIMNNKNIKLWCHGHIHDFVDYNIEGTRVICNPRGYKSSEFDVQQTNFNETLTVEV